MPALIKISLNDNYDCVEMSQCNRQCTKINKRVVMALNRSPEQQCLYLRESLVTKNCAPWGGDNIIPNGSSGF